MTNSKEGGAVNPYREVPLRYMGYANELGESFRPLIPVSLVRLSYVAAFGYVGADTRWVYQNALKEKENNLSSSSPFSPTVQAFDCLLWQTLASVFIPGYVIHSIVKISGKLVDGASSGPESMLKKFPAAKTYLPTVIGLASIPLIIHPIDTAVELAMEHSIRKKYHKEFSGALSHANKTTPIFLEAVAGFWFLREDVAQYSNAWRFCEDHHDDWGSTLEALLCHVDQKALHLEGSPSAWPYLDLMMIGGEGCKGESEFVPHCPKQTDDMYKTEFVVWSLLQSPMIVSTDVRVMTPVMEKALLHRDLVALHQDTTCRPGRFLGRDGERGLLFGREVGDKCDEWVVALVNMSGKEWETITLPWEIIGLEATSCRLARLWFKTI